MKRFAFTLLLALLFTGPAFASDDAVIGSVDTSLHLIGANDTIKVIRLSDPDLPNVYCEMASAITGGLSGSMGIASDKSEYELNCYTTGPVNVPGSLPDQAEIAMERRSAFFKKLHIVRMIDRQTHRLVYLAYTTWFIDGSPKHAMSSVPYH